MQQKKSSYGLFGNPPAEGTGNDGFFQGAGNPSPEEWEVRQLPTQPNMFPHQVSPMRTTIDDEIVFDHGKNSPRRDPEENDTDSDD